MSLDEPDKDAEYQTQTDSAGTGSGSGSIPCTRVGLGDDYGDGDNDWAKLLAFFSISNQSATSREPELSIQFGLHINRE